MKMRKVISTLLLLVVLCALIPYVASDANAAEAQSAAFINRSDGIWLWPAPSYAVSDWAGCNGDWACYFHTGNNHGGCAAAHETSNGFGHNGMDMPMVVGTEIYATAPGVLYCTNTDWQYRGITAVIEHPISGTGFSYYSVYQHLQTTIISKNGANVAAGEIIAYSGNTDGFGTGQAHLHFSILMSTSGQGNALAQAPNSNISAIENHGWITSTGYASGRILVNPALNSPAGDPLYTDGCGNNVRLHAGSIMYTRNPAEVSIGENKISYATITEGAYALKNKSTGAYAVVENNTDVCGQNMIAANRKEGFAVTNSTTTEGYALRPLCSAGGKMNVYTDYVTSGNTVCLWDDTGHASQRWYFEEVSGGYVIRSVQTPSCVLDIRDNNDVYVSTYTGASSQIWVLEKVCETHTYDNACDKTCNGCGEVRTVAAHKYNNACDKTCNICQATRTTSHNYSSATCTKAKTCNICGATRGSALSHSYKNGSCTRCNYKPAGVKITKQPVSVTVSKGATAKVTVKATGDGLTYRWYYKNAGDSSYTYTSSFKGNTYSVTMNAARNGRRVLCRVYDKYGNVVKSNTVTLSMKQTVKITKQPTSVTVARGATAKVTVKATGDGLTYRWYYKNAGDSSYTYTSSFKGNTYQVTMNDARNGRTVLCRVYDKHGNVVKTNSVKLTMKQTVKITKQPVSVTVAKGTAAKVTVKATGDGLTYRWYYKNARAGSYTYTSSFKGNTYSVAMNAARNGRRVLCRVYDKYGNMVKSNSVVLRMK